MPTSQGETLPSSIGWAVREASGAQYRAPASRDETLAGERLEMVEG